MKKVLIIDDDPVLCQTLAEILIDEGHTVESSHEGIQGLAMMSENDYDVIFSDIKLPGMNGIELLKRVRDNPPKARIFIISGAPDTEQRLEEEGLSHIISGILPKPFKIETMLKMVNS